MSVWILESKVMAFCGKYPIRTKICISKPVKGLLSHLLYLSSAVLFLNSVDILVNLQAFERKETKLKFYKTMVVTVMCMLVKPG